MSYDFSAVRSLDEANMKAQTHSEKGFWWDQGDGVIDLR